MEKQLNKRESLKKLDELVCENLIEMMEKKDYDLIPSLSVAVNYLKINEQVSEKEKVTASSMHKQMVEEARKKRANANT